MFIVRTIFWLGLIIFLLPTGNTDDQGDPTRASDEQTLSTGKALSAAYATVDDLSSFCQRNPDPCKVGEAALAAAEETAKSGVRAIYRWATSEPAKQPPTKDDDSQAVSAESSQRTSRLGDDVEITGSIALAASSAPKSANTLRIEDIIPEWSGPRSLKRA